MLEGEGKKEERRNTEDKKESEGGGYTGGMGGFGKADRLTPGASRTRGGERMRRQTGKRPNRPPFLLFGLSLPPLLQKRLSESVRRQLLPPLLSL